MPHLKSFNPFFFQSTLQVWSHLILAWLPSDALNRFQTKQPRNVAAQRDEKLIQPPARNPPPSATDPPPRATVGLCRPLAGTSNHVKTGRRGRGRTAERGGEAFIADPSAHFAPRNPPGGNRREEERAASVAQRRYNNRSEGNQLMIPKPARNLGSSGGPQNK